VLTATRPSTLAIVSRATLRSRKTGLTVTLPSRLEPPVTNEAPWNNSPGAGVSAVVDGFDTIGILAISGSLRRVSSNSALVEALARLAPDAVDVSIYRELAELPPFNPDLDGDSCASSGCSVSRSAAGVRRGPDLESGVRHGVPGVLKNALDWVVGSGELVDKPVALINASPTRDASTGLADRDARCHVGRDRA
jgi:hypothetical protein